MFSFSAPLNVPPMDKTGFTLGWMGFFSSVATEKKQWIPTIIGLTGTPTVSASWTRTGPNVRIYVSLAGSSTSSSTTLTLPFRCADSGSAEFWNASSKTLIGHGFISGTTLYFPAWSGITNAVFFGTYPLENK